MKQTEINFTNMTDAVISGFDAKPAVWEAKVPITNALLNVRAHRTQLEGLTYQQAAGTTSGATQVLKDAMAILVRLTLQVVKKIRPYATATSNSMLLASVDYSKSELEQGRNLDTINKSKVVLEACRTNQSAMNGYELTVDELSALESAINGVALLSGNRDAIIGARKTATDGIPEVIGHIRHNFEMLDDLVPAMLTDEQFVSTYKNNRRIIDR